MHSQTFEAQRFERFDTLETSFPLTVHTLDPATATALAVIPDGAIAARPDAQVVAHWPSAPADPAAALSTLAPAWSATLMGRLRVSAGAG